MVTVYTQPRCQPCKATIRRLEERGVSYLVKEAAEHVDDLKALGHSSAPVVVTGTAHWSGYRPDLIDEIPA